MFLDNKTSSALLVQAKTFDVKRLDIKEESHQRLRSQSFPHLLFIFSALQNS